MIKTIVFDLGGVIITLDQNQAIGRFEKLGLKDVASHLDPYTQQGIFGQLESGAISAEEFRQHLSRLVGSEITMEQCNWAWQGYAKELPQRNLDTLVKLREQGYRLVLLSNTNPCMMEWALSTRFDGSGHSIDHYFDAMYLSYRLGVMKPDDLIFRKMLMAEKTLPEEMLFVDDGPRNVAAASQIGIRTYCPQNGVDWTETIYEHLA